MSKKQSVFIKSIRQWKILLDNLSYIKELFEGKHDKKLILNFVVQKENYLQMKEFVNFAKKFSAKCVKFQYFTNWGTVDEQQYLEMNVMHPQNLHYKQAKSILESIIESQTEIDIMHNIPTIH